MRGGGVLACVGRVRECGAVPHAARETRGGGSGAGDAGRPMGGAAAAAAAAAPPPRRWYVRPWWAVPAAVALASYAVLAQLARVDVEPTASSCEAQVALTPNKGEALAAYPWICGGQEIAPELDSPVRVYAYTQPTGSWCWSNGGLIVDEGAGTFSVVDTATDARLTARMRKAYEGIVDVDSAEARWLLFTHGDIDHVWGADVMAALGKFGVVAHKKTADMIDSAPNPEDFALKINRGRLVWALLAPGGEPRLALRAALAVMPTGLRDHALALLGRLRAAEFFAPFHFDEVTRNTRASNVYDERVATLSLGGAGADSATHKLAMHKVEGAHSPGDTFIHVPQRDVVFAGDLLFIGVSPLMWVGPAESFVAALKELLATGASLFVPGHGPVTDRGGVEASIDYWEYVAKGAEACFSAGADADDCGLEMLADLPTPWKDWTDPERILVNVKVQYGHLAAPGEFKVNSTLKFDLIGEQGKYLVKKQLGYL